MPVSSVPVPADEPPVAKRCKHCQESGHSIEEGAASWRIALDQDLLDTLVAIYPDWFKEPTSASVPAVMAEASPSGGRPPSPPIPLTLPPPGAAPVPSPPKAEVDDTPLHMAMDRNKESLKVKLMLRRPITQLVAQGIMPPLKTPPAFFEQRKQLERAKTGDLLKAKIQQRPDRQELVRQHILEADMDHVDPSLAERQRMLKKCRLADSLNDQLSHRPGPLELIQKNILHADEPIERAVKEGVIPFKATCEGQVTKPQHPHRYITMDEDSQSSGEGVAPSPPGPAMNIFSPQTPASQQSAPSPAPAGAVVLPRRLSGGSDMLETAAANAGIVTLALSIPSSSGAPNTVVVTSTGTVLQQQTPVQRPPSLQTFAELCGTVSAAMPPVPPPAPPPAPSPISLGSSTSSLSPLSSVASPPSCSAPSPVTARPPTQASPAPAPALSSQSLPLPVALRTDAPGKDKNRKKSKTKAQPKTRTIKFHEYKGPPNAHKNSAASSSAVETSYELLLQQQQLFLQCQLEWLHKYPQIILPAAQKPSSTNDGTNGASTLGTVSTNQSLSTSTLTPVTSGATTQLGLITVASANPSSNGTVSSLGDGSGTLLNVGNGTSTLLLTASSTPSPVQSAITTIVPPPSPQTITVTLPAQQPQQASTQPAPPPPPTPAPAITPTPEPVQTPPYKVSTKLEDMKVSDLKLELKKRNLPVSGSKPQLIERIRNADAAAAAAASSSSNNDSTPAAQPMEVQNTASEDSISEGFSVDTLTQSSPSAVPADSPSIAVAPQPMSPVSPVAAAATPVSASPVESVQDMDTTPISPAPSPVTREDLIREQQRQIKELQKQVKLLRSQQHQEGLRSKDTNQKPALRPSAAATIISASGLTNAVLDTSKATVKQHLQNKIQQQQQQQQHLQQQLQQPQISFQPQQGLNAKASLAAYLQQQAASPTNNNNNNNVHNNNVNNNIINKKLSKIVLPQTQNLLQPQKQNQQVVQPQTPTAALVLNRINLQRKPHLTSVASLHHQRTNSLPNFLSSMVQIAPAQTEKQTHSQRASSLTPMATSEDVDMQAPQSVQSEQPTQIVEPSPVPQATHRLVLTRTATEPHILTLTTAPAVPTSGSNATATIMATTNGVVPLTMGEAITVNVSSANLANTTVSNIVAGNLVAGNIVGGNLITNSTVPTNIVTSNGPNILTTNIVAANIVSKLPQYEVSSLLKNIKQENLNGKTNPVRHIKSQIVDDVLDILIKSGELPPSAAQDPTTPTTPGSVQENATNASEMCNAFNESQNNNDIFSEVFSNADPVGSEPQGQVQNAPTPPPPPPPPAPPLPHTTFAVTLPTTISMNSTAGMPASDSSFGLYNGSNPLEFVLGSSAPPATSVDLKELGLDLDVLDSMDFSQLDHNSVNHDIKMENDLTMDTESDHHGLQQGQQHITEQLLGSSSDLMDICEIPEMDSEWLDSLMTPSEPTIDQLLPTSSFSVPNSQADLDSYDPLLSTNQDPLDLFGIDNMDSDFKVPNDFGLTLNWDRADFAT